MGHPYSWSGVRTGRDGLGHPTSRRLIVSRPAVSRRKCADYGARLRMKHEGVCACSVRRFQTGVRCRKCSVLWNSVRNFKKKTLASVFFAVCGPNEAKGEKTVNDAIRDCTVKHFLTCKAVRKIIPEIEAAPPVDIEHEEVSPEIFC
jgi:hypothetical protein